MSKTEIDNPVEALISKKSLDPRRPEDAAVISQALLKLGYCADTMAQLLERLGKRKRDKKTHQETYDALSQDWE